MTLRPPPPHLRDHLAEGRPKGLFHSTPCSCTLVLMSRTSESVCSMDDQGDSREFLDEDENILLDSPQSVNKKCFKKSSNASQHTPRGSRQQKKQIPISQQGGMMQLPMRSSAGGRPQGNRMTEGGGNERLNLRPVNKESSQ